MTDEMETKPMLTAILERINALGEQMNERFEQVNARLDRIEESVDKLHAKVDILNEEMLDLRASHRLLSRRVDNLESKAS